MTTKRYDSLDYLRGIMAFAVMIYHYVAWNDVQLIYPFDQTLNRLGVYAVSMFYIVSGATLSIVYINRKIDKQLVRDFTIRRIFRIAPLFYLACTLKLLFDLAQYVSGNGFSSITNFIIGNAKVALLNYSLLFSWFSPNTVIPRGGWSIGNELVFYSVLLVLFLALKKSIRLFQISVFLIFIGSFSFSYIFIDSNSTIVNEWNTYALSLNQMYFFAGGLILGFVIKKEIEIHKFTIITIIVMISAIFAFLPITGSDAIHLVTGWGKVVFSSLMFILCLAVGFWTETGNSFINKVLKFLGETSYSIYLMHPLVYFVTDTIFSRTISLQSNLIKIVVSVLLTIFVSKYTYSLIEKPFIKISRTWTFKNLLKVKKVPKRVKVEG